MADTLRTVLTDTNTVIVTNKTLDSDDNVIQDIVNADIKAAAAIDASKIADGSVSNAEFQYLANVTSDIQTQLNAAATDTDLSDHLNDASDAHDASAISNIPSGNLAATDVQAALNELQSDIDTRATTTALSNHESDTTSIHGISDTSALLTETNTKTVSNKTLTSPEINGANVSMGTASNTNRIVLPTETTTNLDALTDTQGLLAYDTSLNKPVYNDGTQWSAIGSGSGTGINYITNGDFEANTTGWAGFEDAAGTSPVDGTGGSPTQLTFARGTTTPLKGNGELVITHAAADAQGEGFSYDFTIDRASRYSVLQIQFDYEITSGTYDPSDGSITDYPDLTCWVYDVTNSVLIQPTPYKLVGAVSGQNYKFRGEFQTSDSTSYRLIFHCPNATATAWTMAMDNIVVGPSNVSAGANVTDWVSFTPSVTWTTNTTNTGTWRRVGDSMEVIIKSAFAGQPAAGGAVITVPNGMSIDTTKLVSTNGRSQVGAGIFDDTSGSAHVCTVTYTSATTVSVRLTDDAATGVITSTISNTSPVTIASGDECNCWFRVPISGWASSSVASQDTDQRVVAARLSGNAASASSGNPIIFPTSDFDTHAAYNASTGRYTCPVVGFYKMHGYVTSGNTSITVSAYKNAVLDVDLGKTDPTDGEGSYTGLIKCNAGDIIDLRPNGTLDVVTGSLNIERISGPEQILASETVAFKVDGSSHSGTVGTTFAGSTTLTWGTVQYDTHNAFSAGVYTVPAAGIYNVKASAFISGTETLNDRVTVAVAVNGVEKTAGTTRIMNTGITTTPAYVNTSVKCVAGDLITTRCYSDVTTPVLNASAALVSFEIQRLN